MSHASGGQLLESRVAQVREGLYERLSKDWDVFLDRESLGAGQRWRADILDALASAQAGVVLFDKRAVTESKWVRAEALMLCFKKSRDPKFQFVPVLFEEQTLNSAAFDAYEPFELNEIQALSDDPAHPPERVAELVAKRFDASQAPASGPRRGWIEETMALVKDDANVLQLAAEQLGIDYQGLGADAVVRGAALLRRAVVQHLHSRDSLASCLRALKDLMNPMSREERERFADYIYSKWVPNQAVEILLGAGRNPKARGLVALNTIKPEVLEHYELRARIEMRPTIVKWVTVSDATGDDEASLVAAVKDALRAKLFRHGMFLEEGTDEELSLEQSVQKLLERGETVVLCCLPPRFGKRGVVDDLRRDFPNVVFLLTKHKAIDLDGLGLDGLAYLKPLLDARLLNDLLEVKIGLSA
jgi:hypothetical protein